MNEWLTGRVESNQPIMKKTITDNVNSNVVGIRSKIRGKTGMQYYYGDPPRTARGRFSAPMVVLLLAILNAGPLFSEALSSSSSFSSSSSSSMSSNDNEPSPWASSSWVLELDFGRPSKANKEETPTTAFSNTTPFSSYGESGSRLVVTCPVVVESEDDVDNKKSPDTFVGRGASVIRARGEDDKNVDEETGNDNKINNDFKYITMQGTKTIEVTPGGWTLQFPPGGKVNRGRASKLRFYLDLTTDLERNDVYLPSGTRLYFAANAWREHEYENGVFRVLPLQVSLTEAQKVLDENLSHETGDRRLDGNDPIETLKAYKDIAALVLDRDRKRAVLRDALDKDGHGYPASDDLPEGPWPGTTEWLTLSENNPIYARVPKTAKTKEKNKGGDGSSKSSNNNMLQQLMGDNQYDYGRVGSWTGEAISSLLVDDE